MADMRFPTTHWSLLLQARGSESRAKEALHHLCSAYWFPLFSFARLSLRAEPQEAEDLTQSFFEHLIRRQVLSRVQKEQGNFRNYLLVAFRNFHRSGLQKAMAEKRGGREGLVPVDLAEAERRLAVTDNSAPEKCYDRSWALEVVTLAYRRTELHYSAQNKLELFRQLRGFLEQPTAAPYEELAQALGKSEGAVRTEVFRLRRLFSEAFRSVVAETVSSRAEVEDEVRYLVQLLTD